METASDFERHLMIINRPAACGRGQECGVLEIKVEEDSCVCCGLDIKMLFKVSSRAFRPVAPNYFPPIRSVTVVRQLQSLTPQCVCACVFIALCLWPPIKEVQQQEDGWALTALFAAWGLKYQHIKWLNISVLTLDVWEGNCSRVFFVFVFS